MSCCCGRDDLSTKFNCTSCLQSEHTSEALPIAQKGTVKSRAASKGVRKVKQTERTLVCFIQALQGMRLVVELRQDTVLRGTLESADEEMNLVMTEATSTSLQGEKQELHWAYVKGHHIRYGFFQVVRKSTKRD